MTGAGKGPIVLRIPQNSSIVLKTAFTTLPGTGWNPDPVDSSTEGGGGGWNPAALVGGLVGGLVGLILIFGWPTVVALRSPENEPVVLQSLLPGDEVAADAGPHYARVPYVHPEVPNERQNATVPRYAYQGGGDAKNVDALEAIPPVE